MCINCTVYQKLLKPGRRISESLSMDPQTSPAATEFIGISQESILDNIRSNSTYLLDRWKPLGLNVVDRSESLRQLYKELASSQPVERKPILTITGAPGVGKTLFTALAVNKIKPAPKDGQLSSDVLDLEGEKEAADWIPIYLTFSDLSGINPEEGARSVDLFRNRILYWLLTDNRGSDGYQGFLNKFILNEARPPKVAEIHKFLESYNLKIVFFIDELSFLRNRKVGATASSALASFVESLNYDATNTWIFSSNRFFQDFLAFSRENHRAAVRIEIPHITSFENFLTPLLSMKSPAGNFLRRDPRNVEMLKLFLWGCFGHPRLISKIMNNSDEMFSGAPSRLQVYKALKEKALKEYNKKFRRVNLDIELVASALCQLPIPNMNNRMKLVNFADFSASYIRKANGSICPFVSPFLMECLASSNRFEPSSSEKNKECIGLIRDLFSYVSEWTQQLIGDPEVKNCSFEEFVPIWLRTYLTCRRICARAKAALGLGSIFAHSFSKSSSLKKFKVTRQSEYWLLKSGNHNTRNLTRSLVAPSEDEADAYRFIVEKTCKNQERFDKGQLIVFSNDPDNLGYDFVLRMIGSEGKPVHLFFVTNPQTEDGHNSIEQAKQKHDMILRQFGDNLEDLGDYALVYFSFKQLKVTREEIEEAGFPLVIFSRDDIVKLIGPSLGFLVPLQAAPEHYVPQDCVYIR